MAHVAACLEAMPRTEAVDPSPQVMACMALAIMMAVADMGGCHPDLKDAQGLAKAYLADADKQDASGVFDNGRSLKQDLEDAFMGALAWADKRGPNGGTAWVNADPDKRQERQQHLERLTLASEGHSPWRHGKIRGLQLALKHTCSRTLPWWGSSCCWGLTSCR